MDPPDWEAPTNRMDRAGWVSGGEVVSRESDGVLLGRTFSAESRASLGLEPDENLRVLARSGRVVLLERGEGAMVPSDRDLVLSCDVRAFPLADLLSLIHDSGKSGYLLFLAGDHEKAVHLSRGEVVFASSNLSTDRLGVSLLRAGLLEHSQLERAERRYHAGTRFGKVVVELGLLTPRDLWDGVKTQVEEIVRSLFSYTGGWVHFWEGEIEPDNVVRLSLPTHRLIEEGLRRRDELVRFLARLEESGTEIVPGTETRLLSSDNERAVCEALACDSSFSGLAHRSGLDPRTLARTLQFLTLTGHAEIRFEDASKGARFSSADDDVVREAVDLHSRLIFELSAPLIALDGAEPVAERLNRVVEESALHGRALLQSVRFDAAATLDPTELEHHALRLPGDRVRAVDDALGELVAYIEFELKNHPRIDDCSLFLEAVDPLRAMLAR